MNHSSPGPYFLLWNGSLQIIKKGLIRKGPKHTCLVLSNLAHSALCMKSWKFIQRSFLPLPLLPVSIASHGFCLDSRHIQTHTHTHTSQCFVSESTPQISGMLMKGCLEPSTTLTPSKGRFHTPFPPCQWGNTLVWMLFLHTAYFWPRKGRHNGLGWVSHAVLFLFIF